MKTLTFAQKLWLPLYVSLGCLTALTGWDAWSLRDVRIEERKNDLANNADNVVSLVSQYAELERRGVLTRDAAQKEAMERIRGMRFGKDGYYTVMTDEPKMLMHPLKPELIGRSLGSFRDANGTPLYRDAVNVAKLSGSGFIRYVWPRPGEERPVPKLTRVSTFKPRLDFSQRRLYRRHRSRRLPFTTGCWLHFAPCRDGAFGGGRPPQSGAATLARRRAGGCG